MSLILGLKSSKNYLNTENFISKSSGPGYYDPIDSEDYFFTQAFKVTNPVEFESSISGTYNYYLNFEHTPDDYLIQTHLGHVVSSNKISFVKRSGFNTKNSPCDILFAWKQHDYMVRFAGWGGLVFLDILFKKISDNSVFATHKLEINAYNPFDPTWHYDILSMPVDINEDFYIEFPTNTVIEFYMSRGNPVYKGLDLYFDINNQNHLSGNIILPNYVPEFGEFISLHWDHPQVVAFTKKIENISINKLRLKVKSNHHISPYGGFSGLGTYPARNIRIIFKHLTDDVIFTYDIHNYLTDDYDNWKIFNINLTTPITDSFLIEFINFDDQLSYPFIADDLFFEFVDEQTQPVQQNLLSFGNIWVNTNYTTTPSAYFEDTFSGEEIVQFSWGGSSTNQLKFTKSANISISKLVFKVRTHHEYYHYWNSQTGAIRESSINFRLGDNFSNPVILSKTVTFNHPNNREYQEIEFNFIEPIIENFTIEINPTWFAEGYFYIQSGNTRSITKTDKSLFVYAWDSLSKKVKTLKIETAVGMMSDVYQLNNFGDICFQNNDTIDITDGTINNINNLNVNSNLLISDTTLSISLPSTLTAITAQDTIVNNLSVSDFTTITGILDIASNFNVIGNIVEILSEQILIKDKIVTINSDGNVHSKYGLEFDRGGYNNHFFGLDNSDIKIGVNSSLQKVAVRADTIVNENLITWNVNQFTGTPDFIQTTNLLIDNKFVNTGNLLTGGGSLTNSLLIQLEEIDENHIIASKDENGLAQLHAPMLSVINSNNFTEALNELNAVSKEISVTSNGLISGGGTLSGDISLKFKQVVQNTILTGKDSGELYTPMLDVITSVNRSDAVTILNVVEKSIEVLGYGLIFGGGNLSNDISLSVSQSDGPIIFGKSAIGNGDVVNVNTPMIDLIIRNDSTEVLEYINFNVAVDDNQFFKEQYIHVTNSIRTISVSEFGYLFTNKNSVETVDITLPLASESTGKFLRFYKLSTARMNIHASAGDKIQIKGNMIYHKLLKITHCLTLYCAPKIGWTLFSGFGEWLLSE